jgi:hypothetical protein
MVIATIGDDLFGALARPSRLAGDWADVIYQRQQLGDVVAVPASQRDRERNPVAVDDQMVF